MIFKLASPRWPELSEEAGRSLSMLASLGEPDCLFDSLLDATDLESATSALQITTP